MQPLQERRSAGAELIMSSTSRLSVLGLFLAVACRESPAPTSPLKPSGEILDATHSGGNVHFFLLPPIVPQPSYDGAFDATFSPVVRICEWTGTACVRPLVAEFTTTTGPGSETVRVDPVSQIYVVNWHTDQFALDVTKNYRIHVLVAGTELGHADVDLVSGGAELKNVNTGAYIPLVDGRTLPIKFRIEEGVLCAGQFDCSEQAVGPAGGTVVTQSGLAGVQIPSGAVQYTIHVIAHEVTGPCLPTTFPGVSGCFEISTDQGADFTLGLAATLGVCLAEPSAAAVLYKVEPKNPALGVVALKPAPVSFLACAVRTAGTSAVGGYATSFSVVEAVSSGTWTSVAARVPRARAAVAPLFPNTNNTTCRSTGLSPYQTGQEASYVLITGGVAADKVTVLGDAEVIRAADLTVTWTGTMNTPRWEHTATLLSDGTVLIAGGIDTFQQTLASAELFIPTPGGSGSFIPVGDMNVPRVHHTATLLGDGRVLITGGIPASNLLPSSATASVEIFDPSTRTFALSGNMTFARERHAATVIPGQITANNNEVVLITGGAGPDLNSSVTGEVYDVALGRSVGGIGIGLPPGYRLIRHTATLQPLASNLSGGPVVLIVGGIGGSGGSASDVSIEIVLNRALSVVGAILRATPPVRDQVAVITGGCNVFVFGGTTDNAGANASDMALYNYNTTYYPDFFIQFPRCRHRVPSTAW